MDQAKCCVYPYLKEIGDLVGIEFNLTHRIARKTFASAVLLYNNVLTEVVSRLLGYSKLQTTQESYGRLRKRGLVWRLIN
ncbi:site-specific integrase [Cognatitamlana onchidii]|uniref:hypothetical protein n=1 Tax=Cognatitamlana onchidii TaxID=2562860 RepID=UPI0010A6B042|nr:hypothetical protein [Algibacter onchidii]